MARTHSEIVSAQLGQLLFQLTERQARVEALEAEIAALRAAVPKDKDAG